MFLRTEHINFSVFKATLMVSMPNTTLIPITLKHIRKLYTFPVEKKIALPFRDNTVFASLLA